MATGVPATHGAPVLASHLRAAQPLDGPAVRPVIPSMQGSKAMKLRSYLATLVLAGVIPLILLSVVVTLSLVHQQRAAADMGLTDTVAALAAAADQEIGASIKSLETLATSRALDTDD